MSNKILIFGGNGCVGRCLYHFSSYLEFETYSVDVNHADYNIDVSNTSRVKTLLLENRPHYVIDATPYFKNWNVAKQCIELGIHYVNLGGCISVSKQINDYKQKRAVSFVKTDLGLAPGLVNVLAELSLLKLSDVDTISLRCGGLPLESGVPPLNYKVSWNIDGLLNEYTSPCLILKDGKIREVEPLEMVQLINFRETVPLECFTTSGAIHGDFLLDMSDKGLKNLTYQTFRHIGHRDCIKTLLNSSIGIENVKNVIQSNSCEECTDVVLVQCIGASTKNHTVFLSESIVEPIGEYSAMSCATAAPVIAAVYLSLKHSQPPSYKFLAAKWDEYNQCIYELGVTIS